MKRAIAILLAFVCVFACFTMLTGCEFTDAGKLQFRQALCNHKWKEERRVKGNCKHSYDVVTYGCSKCKKEKKEEVAIPVQHDWQESWSERAVDCQHKDWEVRECSVCRIQYVEELETYGPHVDGGNGECWLCGHNVDN